MEKQFRFDYEHYASLAELPEADRQLSLVSSVFLVIY